MKQPRLADSLLLCGLGVDMGCWVNQQYTATCMDPPVIQISRASPQPQDQAMPSGWVRGDLDTNYVREDQDPASSSASPVMQLRVPYGADRGVL
ncbi:hypothetical protein K493DRAFT_315419 [Basidiobolus meristosporus CBS 931.73]|uniref:Uncharacterized protein n=1 Tax=Basidiobolus meristosporus CBS 931.73 TaxID=1314790 RepID=A0A1Y1Y9I8_9FUNG|nr:hypothetical protein K493DRAFT_315419 [Basidiobolus meristosporus CBS 931.73]|eukprot:ORX94555.1 hypothetical protein K493DRAFT_315419 [Basidiobolus meristosporus CBS 931.73]